MRTLEEKIEAHRKTCRKYYRTHRKKVLEQQRKHREARREEIAAYNRNYQSTHREEISKQSREYYKAHRKEILEQQRVYHKANHEKNAKRDHEYYKSHREERAMYNRQYHKAKPEKHRACGARRRALKQGALIGATIEQLAEIAEIYRRASEDDKVRCYLCGKLIPKGHRHVDHIVPLSKGGKHRPSNLAVACDKCNLGKHDKTPENIGLLL